MCVKRDLDGDALVEDASGVDYPSFPRSRSRSRSRTRLLATLSAIWCSMVQGHPEPDSRQVERGDRVKAWIGEAPRSGPCHPRRRPGVQEQVWEAVRPVRSRKEETRREG